jgi:DNA-directed RNA polymerase subunit N (RpoN/RPB10)
MIIPIRCMNCGKTIADKWRYYQQELQAIFKATGTRGGKEDRVYFDGKPIQDTPEKSVLDRMKITRSCCRKHFLTQVDLIDKI